MGRRISALTQDTAPSLTDYVPSVDVEAGPAQTKRVTWADVLELIAENASAPIARLVGEMVPYGGITAPSGWLLCYGQAVSRATYSDLFDVLVPSKGTFTVTIASPAVVTLNSHGLQTGDAVYLTTTGALPTGLTANTLYYVEKIDANTFNLSTTRANAYAGTNINTSGSQSGTHTLRQCPYGLGDGSTTFNVPDYRGRMIAGNDSMGGTAASRLTAADTTNGVYGNLGAAGGSQSHTLTEAETPSVQHKIGGTAGRRAYTPDFNNGTAAGGGAAVWGADTISNHGSGNAHNNVPPSQLANVIIKT